jgi:hypothetical protein
MFGCFTFNRTTEISLFVDETLPQQSGIFFENQGSIKIETSKWDLTAYLRVSEYTLNTEVLRQHIANAADYCFSTITNTTNQDCTRLYKATSFTFSQIEEKLGIKEAYYGEQ